MKVDRNGAIRDMELHDRNVVSGRCGVHLVVSVHDTIQASVGLGNFPNLLAIRRDDDTLAVGECRGVAELVELAEQR